MKLTNHNNQTKMTAPQHEVGFSSSFFRLGDNTPLSTVVFLRPKFTCLINLSSKLSNVMTALFGRPLRSVAPSRDSANSSNAVTRFLAGLRDGFTHFRLGITA